MKRSIPYLAAVSVLAFWPLASRAQSRPEQLRSVPSEIRTRLAQRLDDFSDAQRTGSWSTVSDLLGEHFYGLGWERTKYSPEQKEWMLTILKQAPMLGFIAHSAGYSSAILTFPLGLKYWIIQGAARYSTESDAKELPMMLIAYRDKGEWYFSPFYRNDCGELRLPDVPDLSPRGKAEQDLPVLTLLRQPGIPVDVHTIVISDVGNIRCTRLRNLTFTITNRTKKTVTGYTFHIQDVRNVGSKYHGSSSGTPHRISPGETSLNKDALRFSDYKPGVLWFASISFSDGTTWSGRPLNITPNKRVSRRRG